MCMSSSQTLKPHFFNEMDILGKIYNDHHKWACNADNIGTTAVCPDYRDVHILDASGVLPVGVVP